MICAISRKSQYSLQSICQRSWEYICIRMDGPCTYNNDDSNNNITKISKNSNRETLCNVIHMWRTWLNSHPCLHLRTCQSVLEASIFSKIYDGIACTSTNMWPGCPRFSTRIGDTTSGLHPSSYAHVAPILEFLFSWSICKIWNLIPNRIRKNIYLINMWNFINSKSSNLLFCTLVQFSSLRRETF